MKKTFVIFTLGLSAFLIGCGDSTPADNTTTVTNEPTEITPTTEEIRTESNTSPDAIVNEVKTDGLVEESNVPDSEIITFLGSIDGTYGWDTTEDDISYDFMSENRLHIQGPDGEATMWEGTWSVENGYVHIVSTERNQDEKLLVKIDGKKLILGDKTYTRYQP